MHSNIMKKKQESHPMYSLRSFVFILNEEIIMLFKLILLDEREKITRIRFYLLYRLLRVKYKK